MTYPLESLCFQLPNQDRHCFSLQEIPPGSPAHTDLEADHILLERDGRGTLYHLTRSPENSCTTIKDCFAKWQIKRPIPVYGANGYPYTIPDLSVSVIGPTDRSSDSRDAEDIFLLEKEGNDYRIRNQQLLPSGFFIPEVQAAISNQITQLLEVTAFLLQKRDALSDPNAPIPMTNADCELVADTKHKMLGFTDLVTQLSTHDEYDQILNQALPNLNMGADPRIAQALGILKKNIGSIEPDGLPDLFSSLAEQTSCASTEEIDLTQALPQSTTIEIDLPLFTSLLVGLVPYISPELIFPKMGPCLSFVGSPIGRAFLIGLGAYLFNTVYGDSHDISLELEKFAETAFLHALLARIFSIVLPSPLTPFSIWTSFGRTKLLTGFFRSHSLFGHAAAQTSSGLPSFLGRSLDGLDKFLLGSFTLSDRIPRLVAYRLHGEAERLLGRSSLLSHGLESMIWGSIDQGLSAYCLSAVTER